MLFYHEKMLNGRSNGFWEVDEDDLLYAEFGDEIRLYNQFGGYHYHILTSEDRFISVSHWDDLPWKDVLINPDSELGWISPSGEFFGCDYRDHEKVAEYILNSSERELEKQGWVKIYSCDGLQWYHERLHPTEEQKCVLREKGFELDEELY